MHCIRCGKGLPDDARFCSSCGSPVPPPKPVCPVCGRELDEQAAFCCYCGTKVASDPVPPQPAGEPVSSPVPGQTAVPVEPPPIASPDAASRQVPPQPEADPAQTAQSSVELYSVSVQWYPADTYRTKNRIEVEGKLYIYSDRVVFKKTVMNSPVNALGLVGLGISAARARKSAPMIFPMDQIASVRESTFVDRLASCPSVVLEMKTGDKHGFVISVLAISESGKQERIRRGRECIRLIQENLG